MRRFVLGAVAGGMVGGCLFWLSQGWQLSLKPVGMDYKDLAAILLGAAALLITVLGVFIAVLAIWGYTQFEKMAKDTTKEFIGLQLSEGRLKSDIEALVSKHIQGTAPLVREQISTSVMTQIEKDFSEGKIRSLLEERLDLAIYGGAEKRAVEEEVEDEGEE